MVFPSRGCRTCKQRRVKVLQASPTLRHNTNRLQCDETRPTCKRCEKANVVCQGVEDHFLFLNENEFAVGRKKRPRGPNVKATTSSTSNSLVVPSNPVVTHTRPYEDATSINIPSVDVSSFAILPGLNIALDEQALTYYTRFYVEEPHDWPEIVEGHLKHVPTGKCYTNPQSVLSLAILAVSHATFGRAQRSHAALAVGARTYSNALTKTNAALRDPAEATKDEVLLAAMLLSFYENSTLDRTVSAQDLPSLAARSFAHHDGAMAMLKLRRGKVHRTSQSHELDKLVRRQLMRSLLLRCLPVPSWLEHGSQYGEIGYALELDWATVKVAELRHKASLLPATVIGLSESRAPNETSAIKRLLAEAQTLDAVLVMWSKIVPARSGYKTYTITQEERTSSPSPDKILDNTVHIYPTDGHAGMWNRYRTLRLAVNDVVLKTLSMLDTSVEPNLWSLATTGKLVMDLLVEELCASVPYVLGLVSTTTDDRGDAIVVFTKRSASLKDSVTATTASFLCWPLAMASMLQVLSAKHTRYMRARLLDVSEIVDDSVLERVAAGFDKWT